MNLVGLRGGLDDTGPTGRLVVVTAGFVLTVVAVAATASPDGFTDARTALAFGAFIALGEVVRITLPGGRDAAPIATATTAALRALPEGTAGGAGFAGALHVARVGSQDVDAAATILRALVKRSCRESAPVTLHVRIREHLTILRSQLT